MTHPHQALSYLSPHWRMLLAEHIKNLTGGKFTSPGARHFTEMIILRFPDGSRADFTFAFHLIDGERGEVAVFTEHCGYHIFPLADTRIDVKQRQSSS